jgi:hypothetical protein
MSTRDVVNSRWYIPLVASTEVVRRSGDLATFDPGNTIGTLPTAPVTPMNDAVMWLDSSIATSIFKTGDSIYRVRDRSGNENNAVQDIPAQQPQDDVPGFNFTD